MNARKPCSIEKRDLAVDMTRSASVAAVESEFNFFLFAIIGEDRNDTPLSVLSTLARLDIDPWQEAAELARLPREAATQRLAKSIAALADGPSAHLEHGKIAAGLIALLPHQACSELCSVETLPDGDTVTKFRFGMYMFAILVIIMMAAQWIVTTFQTPAQIDSAGTSISRTVLRQLPPPKSSQ
jgi:hypothetical protein